MTPKIIKSSYQDTIFSLSSFMVVPLFSYLQHPSQLNDDPLHPAQVEEHGDEEAEEVDHAQDLEHEHLKGTK